MGRHKKSATMERDGEESEKWLSEFFIFCLKITVFTDFYEFNFSLN
jgi:hypothetical protein